MKIEFQIFNKLQEAATKSTYQLLRAKMIFDDLEKLCKASGFIIDKKTGVLKNKQ